MNSTAGVITRGASRPGSEVGLDVPAPPVVLDGRSDDELDADRPRRSGSDAVEPLGYLPGLDGLRALAVIAVLFYHAHFTRASGGFLGVSVFFTLSGFLITSLLLRERATTGTVSLRRFWSRRFRRLMPASLLCLGGVVLAGLLGAWDGDQVRALRTDVPAALGQVINLVYINSGHSYEATTKAPSPLNHFWSLAIEEQFYLLFPLLVTGVLLAARGRRRILAAVLALLTTASVLVTTSLAPHSIDRVYFGLDTRAAELLIGGLAACATVTVLRFTHRAVRVVVHIVGVAGLVGLVLLATTVHYGTRWLYPWGLLLCAVCTVSVVLTIAQRGGPLHRLLSWKPLVWCGTISYGLYLFHWPLFAWLNPARTGLSKWPLFALQCAVTFAGAVASFHLLEQPIRLRRRLSGRTPLTVAPMVVLCVLVANGVATASPPPANHSISSGQRTAPAVPPPQRMLVVGDEIAQSLVPTGTETLHREHSTNESVPNNAGSGGEGPNERRSVTVRSLTATGCGVAVGGSRRQGTGAFGPADPPQCDGLFDRWSAEIASFQPDVVVVEAGSWDLLDRRIDVRLADPTVRHPGDPDFDRFLESEIASRVDTLSAGGATVVWLRLAPMARPAPQGGVPAADLPENDTARVDAFNAVLDRVAASNSHLRVLDLARWLASLPGGALGPDNRVDGTTFTPQTASAAMSWIAQATRDIDRRTATEAMAAAAEPVSSVATAARIAPAPAVGPRSVPAAGEPLRIMVAGDSVAMGYGFGLKEWATHAPGAGATVSNVSQFNCPIARGGSYRDTGGELAEFGDYCDWSKTDPGWLKDNRPNLVVLSTGVWDTSDRLLPGSSRWTHLGEPVADQYFLRELVTRIDLLSSAGARVVLMTHHHIEHGLKQGITGLPESEPARMDRLNELLHQASDLRPAVTAVADLAGWLNAQPGGFDPGPAPP
ncbi:MAG: acyltransferase family protein [Microthrixaceae bacterium]